MTRVEGVSSVCPSIDDLIAYQTGALPDVRQRPLLAHVADCESCRQALAAAVPTHTPAPGAEGTQRYAPDQADAAGYGSSMLGIAVGNYRIQRQIGSGGMGLVYLAEHPEIGRRAAVKIIHPDGGRDDELVRRFLNEARAAAAIRHPNIVDVFDLGRLESGAPYILMELLEGSTLGALITRRGPLPLALAVDVMRQVGSALEASHAKGIIHRDLKPDNVFLVEDPARPQAVVVKVLDFGIAKLTSTDRMMRTQSGALLGTPLYMALEQFAGAERAGPATDQYALAAITYQMLTARAPYAGSSIIELIDKQRAGDRARLAIVRGDLPRALDEVLDRALAPDPESRFSSVGAFVEAFQRAAAETAAQAPANARGSRRAWLLGAVSVATLATLGAVGWQRPAPPPAEVQNTSPPPEVHPPPPPPEPARPAALLPDAAPPPPDADVAPKREIKRRKPRRTLSEPQPI